MEGEIISDRYRLVRLLGKGGMGSVWLAEHLTLKSEVAVKLIDAELGKLPQPRARFLREAQIGARIRSAHVVQVYDHGVTPAGLPYIAMEYLIGASLRERLDQQGRLSCAATARIISHVCRGLARAHEAGLIHRDLKPENIFIVGDASDEIVKVLDFGVAKASDALAESGVDPTRTGALMGTPYYMSPEQAQGLKNIDHRTDLWGLGVVAFECLVGKRPFMADALGPLIGRIMAAPIPAPSVAAPDAKIPVEVDAWMQRALARDLGQRFGSARELSEAFMVAAGTVDSLSPTEGWGSNRPSAIVPVDADGEVAVLGVTVAAFPGPPPKSSRLELARASLPSLGDGSSSSSDAVPLQAVPHPSRPSPPSRVAWIVAVVVLSLTTIVLAFIALRR